MKSEQRNQAINEFNYKLASVRQQVVELTQFQRALGRLVISDQMRKTGKKGIAAQICEILEKQGK